jgi:hypothetical protein
MKNSIVLTIMSLLSILLLTLHLSGDILLGIEKGGLSNLTALPITVVWLYGTLVLFERRSGYIIILLGSLLGLGVPIIHMMGKGLGAQTANFSGAFFFIWTIIAIGVTTLFSIVLSVRGLWNLRGGERTSGSGPLVNRSHTMNL